MRKMFKGKKSGNIIKTRMLITAIFLIGIFLSNIPLTRFIQSNLFQERTKNNSFMESNSYLNFENEANYSKINSYDSFYTYGYDYIWADIVIQDGIAYVIKNNLYIYNLSNPIDPILIGKYTSSYGPIVKIILNNQTAYLICCFFGFVILDLSELSNPFEIGKFGRFDGTFKSGTAEYVVDGCYDNGFIYLATSGNLAEKPRGGTVYVTNLYVLNVSNPRNITPIDFITDKQIQSFAVVNNTCYLLHRNFPDANGILDTYRMNNNSLEEVKSIDLNENIFSEYYYWFGRTEFIPSKIYTTNDILFISNGYHQSINKLFLFNITNNLDPILINTVNFDDWADLVVKNNFVYSLTEEKLRIHELIALNNLEFQYERNIVTGYRDYQMTIFDNFLYIVGEKLTIYNITNPIYPSEVVSINFELKLVYFYSIEIVEDLLQFDRNDLIIQFMNISNPCNLSEFYNLNLSNIEFLTDFYDYAYYKEGLIYFSHSNDYIVLVNCSDINNPQFVMKFDTTHNIEDMIISNDILIVDNYYYLTFYNISSVMNPIEIGTITTYDNRISVSNNLVMTSSSRDGVNGIRIYDIADNLNEIGNYANDKYITAGSMKDNIVCFASYNEIFVIDISNPNQFLEIDNIELTSENEFIYKIELADNHIFALTYSAMYVYDIVILEYLEYAGYFTCDVYLSRPEFDVTTYGFIDFEIKDDFIYLLHNLAGLIIIGIDSDNDFLADYLEENHYETDINNSDSDFDGVLDGFEVYTGLNPLNETDGSLDQDGDGLNNINEGYYLTNPFNDDTDRDGLTDFEEIIYETPPTVFDIDQDGLSDGVEIKIYGTSPFMSNTDEDRYDDFLEILMGRDPLIWDRDLWINLKFLFGLYLIPVYVVIIIVSSIFISNIIKRKMDEEKK